MRIRDIIKQLQQQGFEIRTRERSAKEGKGVRITSINGVHYTGSKGNEEARAILGLKLSAPQKQHLESIRVRKGRFGSKKKDPIPEEVKKKIAKLQRQFKKRGLKEGMPTLRNYRYVMKHYSKEEADRLLDSASRYAKDIAYLMNIQALLEHINLDLGHSNNSDIAQARDIIKDYYNIGAPNFKDSELVHIYELLYAWEQNPLDKAKARAVLNYVNNLKNTSWK